MLDAMFEIPSDEKKKDNLNITLTYDQEKLKQVSIQKLKELITTIGINWLKSLSFYVHLMM